MKSFRLVALGVLSAGLIAQGAHAQSLRDLQFEGRNDVRATVSITIPLGGARGSVESASRVEFGFDNQIVTRGDDADTLRFDPMFEDQERRSARISLTLQDNPRLLMNGHQVTTFGPRLTADEEGEGGGGLGTGGWILLGTAAAIGAGFLISEIVKDDIEDAIRGD